MADGEQSARSRLREMAGALCLSIEPPDHTWMITGGEVDTGLFILDGPRITVTTWEACVPRLGREMSLDREATERMAMLLDRREQVFGSRFARALELVGSGWRQHSKERFLALYAALDAWFDKGRRQSDVISGVTRLLGGAERDRIGRLTGLRDELAHGKGATVQAAPSYLSDRAVLHQDPVHDLFRIVRVALLSIASHTEG